MTTRASSSNFGNDIVTLVLTTQALGPKIANIAITNASYVVTGANILSNSSGGYVKVIGSNFYSNSQILFRFGRKTFRKATTVSFINSNEIRAQLPSANIGSHTFYVVNTDGRFAANTVGYV